MGNRYIVISIVVAVCCVIIFMEIRNRLKLKAKVRNQWGEAPYQIRFDKEKSLKTAWQTEKNFSEWDSEIDDLTWNDLDLFDVFETINATYSSIGSQALYCQLRNYHFKKDEQLEKVIKYYEENPQTREKVQYQFARLGKQDNNLVTAYLSKPQNQLGNLYIYLALGLFPFIGVLLLLFGQLAGGFFLLASAVLNPIYYMIKKLSLETELNSMRYFVQMIATANKLAKIETPLQKPLQEALKPLRTIPQFGFAFRLKGNTEADLIFDYLNMVVMLPFISYSFVLNSLQKNQKKAIQVWQLLGKLELAVAILNFRTYMPLSCEPEFQEDGVTAESIYHPLLEEPVTNPLHWKKNTLVTGSNASGKSTYIKSVAINCILAQTIQTALASSFSLAPGHVITSMAVEDNIFEGDSYFIAEIKSIKRLLTQVETNEKCYCFIDEILKGTNTIERIAASSSVVHWLRNFPSLAFIATHDIELTEILKTSCKNVHFAESVTKEEGVVFDYLLKSGPARVRNAISLLKVLDYPVEIIQSAQKEAAHFDHHRKWQPLSDS